MFHCGGGCVWFLFVGAWWNEKQETKFHYIYASYACATNTRLFSTRFAKQYKKWHKFWITSFMCNILEKHQPSNTSFRCFFLRLNFFTIYDLLFIVFSCFVKNAACRMPFIHWTLFPSSQALKNLKIYLRRHKFS